MDSSASDLDLELVALFIDQWRQLGSIKLTYA